MTLETILSDLATASDLNELVCSLNALEDNVRSDVTGHKLDAYADTTSLPTFGGPEPRDTRDIWSWDAEMFLRNAEGRWFLERRDDLAAA